LNFEKDYKDTKVILLEENYRSTKNILNVANDIIKNNVNRKDKNLWTSNEAGDKITYKRCIDEHDEASYIVSRISSLLSQGVSKESIAILYRTNSQSSNFESLFIQE
jgi:DNA helicase-2/ATP-dependent DNA helicase PcrA